MIKEELLAGSEWYRDILAHHTQPREVGDVLTATKPKMAALIHFVLLGDQNIAPPTLDDVSKGIRETYQGPLTLTQDLMKFEITKDRVLLAPIGK